MKKKIFLSCLILLGAYLPGPGSAYSQSPYSAIPANKNSKESIEGIAPACDTIPVSSNVLESFNKMYAGATSVSWSKDDQNNFSVYFEWKGKVIRAGFNRKAELAYAVSSYNEEHLPVEIKLRVKETYYGKSIFGVTEVYVEGKTAYLISLEDKTSWLLIKVLDGATTEGTVWLKS